MTLLQVLYSGLGGHGSVAFSLKNGDRDNEFKHQMLFYGVENTVPEYINQCSSLGIESNSIIKKNTLKSWFQMISILFKMNPDYILLHSTTAIFPCFIYSKIKRKKIIVIDHQANEKKRKIDWFFVFVNLFLASKYVVLTNHSLEGIVWKFPFKKRKISVINNGIDLSKFCPNNLIKEKNIICMVGRMNSLRDFNLIVDSFDQLAGEFSYLELHFAGNGENFLSILNRCKSSPYSDRIKMLGLLGENEIIELLQSTLVYIHSSLADNMSTAVMQAMACGTSVVASNIDGLKQMISPNVNGILFEPGDVTDLTLKLRAFLNNPINRENCAIAGYKKAKEEFSNLLMFNKYKMLINSL